MELFATNGKMVITQNESLKLKLTVYIRGGNTYQPTEADEFILTVKTSNSKNSKTALEKRVRGDSSYSCVDFILNSSETASLGPGKYYYDIWLKNETMTTPLVNVSILECLPSLFEG